MASANPPLPKDQCPVAFQSSVPADLPARTSYELGPSHPDDGRLSLLCHSIAQTPNSQYRNMNLFSITYAFRPRLRIRLTLGGRTLPRKPWDYGGRDSRPTFRYSCPHNHFHAVHVRFPLRFYPAWNAPLPSQPDKSGWQSAASAVGLSPDHFRRGITRLVSCYALFK